MDLWVPFEKITLDREGRWLSNGEEITHEETVRAFARHLVRENDGWVIRIGRESKPVEVEDTPYFVVRVDGDEIILNDGGREKLDTSTLRYAPGRLVCRVRGHEARFLRAPYYELLRDVEADDAGYWVTVAGKRTKLA